MKIISQSKAVQMSPTTKNVVGAIEADATLSKHDVEREAQAKLGAVRLVHEPVIDRDDEDTVTYLVVRA